MNVEGVKFINTGFMILSQQLKLQRLRELKLLPTILKHPVYFSGSFSKIWMNHIHAGMQHANRRCS